MIRKPEDHESAACLHLLYQSGERMFSYFLIDQAPRIHRTLDVFYSNPKTPFSKDAVLVKVEGGQVCGMILALPSHEMKQREQNMIRYGFKLLRTMGIFRMIQMLLRSGLSHRMRLFQNATEYYISNIAVSEERRNQGIGWELLEAVEAIARQKGYRALTLAVEFYNVGAKRLYERFGFVEVDKVVFPKRLRKFHIDGFYKMEKVLFASHSEASRDGSS